MQDQIIEFANVLRRNGVRVSLSENIDAFRAIDLLGIEDPSLFRAALRTTLVKRTIDLRPFDELFDLFFLGYRPIPQSGGPTVDGTARSCHRRSSRSCSSASISSSSKWKESCPISPELCSAATRENWSACCGKQLSLKRNEGSTESFRFTPFTKIASDLELDRLQDEIERLKRTSTDADAKR